MPDEQKRPADEDVDAPKKWRYFLRANPQDAVNFANQPPAQLAGEAQFSVRDDGRTDTFLFF